MDAMLCVVDRHLFRQLYYGALRRGVGRFRGVKSVFGLRALLHLLTYRLEADQASDGGYVDDPAPVSARMRFLLEHLYDCILGA